MGPVAHGIIGVILCISAVGFLIFGIYFATNTVILPKGRAIFGGMGLVGTVTSGILGVRFLLQSGQKPKPQPKRKRKKGTQKRSPKRR